MKSPRSTDERAASAAQGLFLVLAASATLLGPSSARQDAKPEAPPAKPPPAPVDPAARKLFVQHCAPCHGETGDGNGTTKLERPARSFKDGGFSYGNTPETIQRTIKNGIPGSLMPSFDTAVSEAERKLLAQYVIALGPEQLAVDVKDTELIVGDRALVVRGKLPPIVPDAPERPRGLMIGTPDGLSFEYRADDVRMLGARQGRFVNRRDWGGRGGDALEPLGVLLFACETAGGPTPWSRIEPDLALTGRLRGTLVDKNGARILYQLAPESGAPLAQISESPRAFVCALGSGIARHMLVETLVPEVRLKLWIGAAGPAHEPIRSGYCNASGDGRLIYALEPLGANLFDLRVLRWLKMASGDGFSVDAGSTASPQAFARVRLVRPQKQQIEMIVLPRIQLAEDEGARAKQIFAELLR